MKTTFVFLMALLAIAHAGVVYLNNPYAYAAHYVHAPFYTQPLVAYHAPYVQPGYVAATRGALHVAPLPGNTPHASHHLNLEPAPGTE